MFLDATSWTSIQMQSVLRLSTLVDPTLRLQNSDPDWRRLDALFSLLLQNLFPTDPHHSSLVRWITSSHLTWRALAPQEERDLAEYSDAMVKVIYLLLHDLIQSFNTMDRSTYSEVELNVIDQIVNSLEQAVFPSYDETRWNFEDIVLTPEDLSLLKTQTSCLGEYDRNVCDTYGLPYVSASVGEVSDGGFTLSTSIRPPLVDPSLTQQMSELSSVMPSSSRSKASLSNGEGRMQPSLVNREAGGNESSLQSSSRPLNDILVSGAERQAFSSTASNVLRPQMNSGGF